MSGSEEIAARLDGQFSSWPAIVGDPASPRLDRIPAPGKWCAREHLAHATRMHGVCAARVRVILARESPLLPPYRAEKDPTWRQWRGLAAAALLGVAAERRAALIAAVRSLSEGDLGRIGVHAALGPMPLSAWIEFFLVHEAHHLYQIFKLVRES
ncbi:MAG TPA: DinB family protein [Thermoanaerobaculia bacterium]|nr:DinB family protein [Thermoanaerobaculia bacterium]